ncbi:MAG: hypothetical protein B6D39_11100 [Anaerolineae bacterium UTCFX2]|jgi:nitrate/nitrite-specific signal transduction histidine kinase|nr:MAG: hypothetical protein B6D39_11100 [Anaerolineae bacterium UTCFX2]
MNNVLFQSKTIFGRTSLQTRLVLLVMLISTLILISTLGLIHRSLSTAVAVQALPAEFKAGLASLQRMTILIALIGQIILFCLTVVAIRFLLKPVRLLTDAATAVAAGDLEWKVPVFYPDEIGKLAAAFNQMTDQLHSTFSALKKQVETRTSELQASFGVSERLASIRDLHELTVSVVEEVQRIFNFYHVHIYLFDELNENLIMVGGTGDVGKILLNRKHQLSRGKGLVARAAETNQVVLVSDTSVDPDWLPNPLLPETKSEAAIPLAIGENVLGVLDVQHNAINGIHSEQAEVLKALGNQIAVAVENARLISTAFEQIEHQTQISALTQKIQSASSIETVLQIALRGLTEALGSNRGSIQIGLELNDPQRN